jgi:hypothetical protein
VGEFAETITILLPPGQYRLCQTKLRYPVYGLLTTGLPLAVRPRMRAIGR